MVRVTTTLKKMLCKANDNIRNVKRQGTAPNDNSENKEIMPRIISAHIKFERNSSLKKIKTLFKAVLQIFKH